MKTIRAFSLSIALIIGGCAVTGSFEYPLPSGQVVRVSGDGKTVHVALRMEKGYSK